MKFKSEEEGGYITSSTTVWFGGGVATHPAAARPGVTSRQPDRRSPTQWFRDVKFSAANFPAGDGHLQTTWWGYHGGASDVPAESAPRLPGCIIPSCTPPLPPTTTLTQTSVLHDVSAVVRKLPV